MANLSLHNVTADKLAHELLFDSKFSPLQNCLVLVAVFGDVKLADSLGIGDTIDEKAHIIAKSFQVRVGLFLCLKFISEHIELNWWKLDLG